MKQPTGGGIKPWLRRFQTNFEISVSVALTYRENFLYFIIFETFFILAQFLTVKVGFDFAGVNLRGWTREQAYILTGINGLSHQVFICFFISGIFGVAQTVWNGAFDYILLKPVPPLIGALMYGQMIVSNFPGLLINALLVVALAWHGADAITPFNAGLAFVLFALGVAVRIGVALMVVTPVFFSERLSDGETSFWAIVRLSGYPFNLYWRSVEWVLTFLVPVALLAYTPAAILMNKAETLPFLAGSVAAGLGFVGLSYGVFSWGVGHYKSVNSGT